MASIEVSQQWRVRCLERGCGWEAWSFDREVADKLADEHGAQHASEAAETSQITMM